MGVPGGASMDPFVDDVVAHDGPRELGCIDADQEDVVVVSPCDELVGEQGRMTEFDSEFLRSCFFDEAFESGEVSERWGELEEVVMDAVFQGCEEGFEPLEVFDSCVAEFLEMGDGAVDFHDPGKIFSLGRPGSDHDWVGEAVEAHVQFDGV